MTTDIVTTTTAFSNAASFESAQRMALALVSSNIVPENTEVKTTSATPSSRLRWRSGSVPLRSP